MRPAPDTWFPAKRYGWGWGPPSAWQGWSILVGFLALIALGGVLILPRRGLILYLAYVAALALIMVGICWLKGEPPRWHWGDGGPA